MLRDRPAPLWQGLGRRCLHFTWGARGAISLEGLGLEVRRGGAGQGRAQGGRAWAAGDKMAGWERP